jgi:hypothetical protein
MPCTIIVQSSYNGLQWSYNHRIIAMIIQPSYNHCTSFVISAMIVQSSYNHRTHYDCSCNACTMLVNNNDDCTNIVEHTRYLAMIVQSLYNHRYFSNYFTIIVQPSYEHCTIIVISAMIVRSLYNHRTTIVRWSYKRRTMIVQLSYNHRTILVQSSYDDRQINRRENPARWKDGGATAARVLSWTGGCVRLMTWRACRRGHESKTRTSEKSLRVP